MDLLNPLASMYCGIECDIKTSDNKDIMANELKNITGYDSKMTSKQLVCGYVFKNGETTYTCT